MAANEKECDQIQVQKTIWQMSYAVVFNISNMQCETYLFTLNTSIILNMFCTAIGPVCFKLHFLLLLLRVCFCGCLSLPPLVNRWRCARFIWCASVWRLAALPTNFLNSGVCVAGFTDDGTVNVPGVVFVVVAVAFKCSVCVFVAFFALFNIVFLLLLFFLLDCCCFVFGLVVGDVVV